MKRQPLKGLLLFSLFDAKGHLVLASVLVSFIGILSLFAGTTPMSGFGTMIIFPTMSLLSHASAAKSEKHKWSKFQLSMPIRRKDVITSRYLFYLFLTLIALLATGLIEGIAYLLEFLDIAEVGRFSLGGIGPLVEIVEAFGVTSGQLSLNILLVATGSALLSCAIYYPLNYTICRGKEELTAIMMLIGHLIITFFLMWLGGRMSLSLNQLVLLGIIAPTLLLVLSYFFTVKVYQNIDV